MKFRERLEKFLELQSKNISFEDISKELEISPSTLRTFLNKRGYKSVSGKYTLIEKKELKDLSDESAAQIEFAEKDKKVNNTKSRMRNKNINKQNDISTEKNNIKNVINKKDNKKDMTNKSKSTKKSSSKAVLDKKEGVTTKASDNKIEVKRSVNTKLKPKKDRKINITQDDLDKLSEVYDWYLEVKDSKSIKTRSNKSSKKDIKIEESSIKELRTTSIRVDKKVWEDFERLCSNSQYTKQEIITQALKEFMNQYKNLL